ncbi:MAG: hypothetical protein A3K65_01220 [Euryarchaeota archaeon RBG_16_68_12]|jgi:hypothetical protein|nr:MAG: hypothetical protein A3K65_01220 [Euryarchaeota archaeon RBG_16_68_12]
MAATTSVKLTDKGKGRLDRLQAKLTLLGYKFTKEEILELALEAASESPGDIIARSQGVRHPIPGWERVYREIVESAEDWGPTSWRDIDRILYGGKLKR